MRDRREDIPILAQHFLAKFAVENQKEVSAFSPEATDFIMNYHWPGNVRELENAIERAVILAKGNVITLAELPQEHLAPLPSSLRDLKEVEREHILGVLAQTGGNYSEAARILGVTRMTLYNKAKAFGVNVKKIDKS